MLSSHKVSRLAARSLLLVLGCAAGLTGCSGEDDDTLLPVGKPATPRDMSSTMKDMPADMVDMPDMSPGEDDLSSTTGDMPADMALCSDRVQNQDESDVDCGGACGSTCLKGDVCATSDDCESATCLNGQCQGAIPSGITNIEVVTSTHSVQGADGCFTTTCSGTKKILGGGYKIAPSEKREPFLSTSRPSNDNAWEACVRADEGQTVSVEVFAVCGEVEVHTIPYFTEMFEAEVTLSQKTSTVACAEGFPSGVGFGQRNGNELDAPYASGLQDRSAQVSYQFYPKAVSPFAKPVHLYAICASKARTVQIEKKVVLAPEELSCAVAKCEPGEVMVGGSHTITTDSFGDFKRVVSNHPVGADSWEVCYANGRSSVTTIQARVHCVLDL